MDPTVFDRLARALGAAIPRRAALGGLLAQIGLAGLAADEASAKGKARRGGRATQRKKRRKQKRCVPRCDRRVCGADGCGGTCGTCGLPSTCDGQGRCVGCQSASDCAAIPCRDVTCDAGVCQYAPAPDGGNCGAGRSCCDGICVNTRTDVANCGGCGQVCGVAQACLTGQCLEVCDVCATGCPFASVQAAVDAALAGGKITVCPGVYTGRVTVGKDLTILGLGNDPSETTLTDTTSATIQVDAGATVRVRNLTVTGSGNIGPVVRNQGTLRLESVFAVDYTSFNDTTIGNVGLGSMLTLADCVVRGNTTAAGGGLSVGSTTTATLIRTRIEGNSANEGGGISSTGTVHLTDGTVVTGNTATFSSGDGGGGILNRGTLTIDASSSVTGNIPNDCVNISGGTGCP